MLKTMSPKLPWKRAHIFKIRINILKVLCRTLRITEIVKPLYHKSKKNIQNQKRRVNIKANLKEVQVI